MPEVPSTAAKRGLLSDPRLRLAALGIIAVGMFVVLRFSPLADLLDLDSLRRGVASAGAIAPLVFVIATGIGLALWVPGSIPTALAPLLFGTWMAVPLNYVACLIGAAGGFWIARIIGGDSLNRLLGGRFRLFDRYSVLLRTRGFETMLYLRLVPSPFAGVSYLAGLSELRFGHYMVATALGILPMNVIITIGAGTVIEGFLSGDMTAILSWRGAVTLVLLVSVFQVPRVVRWGRATRGWFGGPLPDEGQAL